MDLRKGIAPFFVKTLVQSTARMAESYVVEEKNLGTAIIDFVQNTRAVLKKYNPDIVHIHAAWDCRSAIFEMIANHMGLFVVVSPHGGLAPEKMEQRFWKEKLPRIIGYQFWMLRKSRLIVAVTEKEHEYLKKLGWKSRIILVPQPATSTVNDEEMASRIMAAYRKVIDTHYLERIKEDEIGFTIRCVKESLWREGHFLKPYEAYDVPDSLSFRRIYIFAHDNNITAPLLEGAKRLGIQMPPNPDISKMPRFKDKAKRLGHKERMFKRFCDILFNFPSISKQEEFPLFTPQGEISLCAFANVYCAMRFNDYDEDRFMEQIRNANLNKFTSKLMELFKDLFNMEEGFMP